MIQTIGQTTNLPFLEQSLINHNNSNINNNFNNNFSNQSEAAFQNEVNQNLLQSLDYFMKGAKTLTTVLSNILMRNNMGSQQVAVNKPHNISNDSNINNISSSKDEGSSFWSTVKDFGKKIPSLLNFAGGVLNSFSGLKGIGGSIFSKIGSIFK